MSNSTDSNTTDLAAAKELVTESIQDGDFDQARDLAENVVELESLRDNGSDNSNTTSSKGS
jgi:hypothetical protein